MYIEIFQITSVCPFEQSLSDWRKTFLCFSGSSDGFHEIYTKRTDTINQPISNQSFLPDNNICFRFIRLRKQLDEMGYNRGYVFNANLIKGSWSPEIGMPEASEILTSSFKNHSELAILSSKLYMPSI